MSKTLNIVARLLARGRKLHKLGAHGEAHAVLTRLCGLRELPQAAAKEIQTRLAHIQLRRRNFTRARRHLAALLTREPSNPAYHQLMARAVLSGKDRDTGRALEHCRRAARLDPENARRLSQFGLLAARHGGADEALAALRKAAELAPDDLHVVRRLVKGLCHLGHADEARAALKAALFRNVKDAGFSRLWTTFQFNQLHEAQQKRHRREAARDADRPRLLPFLRPHVPTVSDDPNVRVDGPACLPAPHLPRLLRRPDQRHAQ